MIRKLVCPSNVWGFTEDASGVLRVRCTGKYCRPGKGEGVIHIFDLATGEIVRPGMPDYMNPNDKTFGEETDHGRNPTV